MGVRALINGIKYNKLTECPLCKGRGGETDVITDDGLGPYYECTLCDGKGFLNIFKKLNFLIWEKIWETDFYKKIIDFKIKWEEKYAKS